MGRSSGDDFGGGFSGGGSGGFDGGGLGSGGFSGGAHDGGRSGDDFGSPGGPPPGGFVGGPVFGGFGGFHVPGPVIINNSGNVGGGGSGGGTGGAGGDGGSGRGCLIFVVLVVVLMLLITAIPTARSCSSGGSSIARSTETREALPADAAQQSAYYTDEDGDWIHQPSKLEGGMRAFYEKTGVWPYVYILPNGESNSVSELKSRAEELYGQLFSDQAHFLLVFCDDGHGSYTCGYAVGSQAKTIMDDEAVGILSDYLDRYYADRSLSEEEIFSKAFEDTGKRIMTVTRSPLVPVAICVTVVVVAGAVVLVLKRRGERKERERRRTQEILSTPIEKLSGRDDEAEQLAGKYEKRGDDEG